MKKEKSLDAQTVWAEMRKALIFLCLLFAFLGFLQLTLGRNRPPDPEFSTAVSNEDWWIAAINVVESSFRCLLYLLIGVSAIFVMRKYSAVIRPVERIALWTIVGGGVALSLESIYDTVYFDLRLLNPMTKATVFLIAGCLLIYAKVRSKHVELHTSP